MVQNEEFVYLYNMKQVANYMYEGVMPVDIVKNKDGKIKFVFRQSDTTEVWDKWKSKKY